MEVEENPSVTRFREYLRIKSVHPNPDYGKMNKSTGKDFRNHNKTSINPNVN